MASLLLSYGADVNARHSNGKTALTLAQEGEQQAIADMLRAGGATIE